LLERAGPCDPRSFVLECERHVECHERLILNDEDQATCQWTIHAFTIGPAKARPSKEHGIRSGGDLMPLIMALQP
jgi:hypothetical protein